MKYKEYDYIRGNTALNPNRKSKEYEVKEKQKQKNLKGKVKTKAKAKKSINKIITKDALQIASIVLILGLLSLSFNSGLYKAQEKLTNLKGQLKATSDEGEALKLELIEQTSLDTIRNNAEKNMISPKINNTVNVDMGKDNFSKAKENKSANN